MKRLVAAWVVGAGVLAGASSARAQNHIPSDTEPGGGPAVAPAVAPSVAPGAVPTATSVSDAQPVPRFGRSLEHSVGFRLWIWNTPAWEVGLFAHVEPGWSGPLTISAGPEYVYRRGNLDIVLGLQYTSFGADAGYFRGSSESDIALEQVTSSLWALYANALFLWGTRVTDWFEFQYGVGVGLGYVGGSLLRTQAYRDASGALNPCNGPFDPPVPGPGGAYCGNDNNHYNYSEPRLGSDQGHIPPVLPWVSLPHLAAHFRPHRNVDIRADFGFALIGFYGGLAAHYVFD